MTELKDRIAIVTGGAVGIGAGIAEELAAQRARVVIADIDPAAAEQTIARIAQAGGEAIAIGHDVTNWDSAMRLGAEVVERFGRIDILVNNAGVSRRAPFDEMSEAEWDRVMDINVKGQFITSRGVIRAMLQADYGRIINIGSICSKKGFGAFAHYCASKFAVLGLTQSMAAEYAQTGITVNCVCPGILMTPLHDGIVEQMAAAAGVSVADAKSNFVGANVPQGRPQTPADVGRMVAFLASEKAMNVTGGSYHVDGGCVMD